VCVCVCDVAALRVKFGGDRWVETCAARASAILITSLGLIYCPFHTKGSHKFILAACAFLQHQNPRAARAILAITTTRLAIAHQQGGII